jgi:hypothetical protein
MQLVLQPSRRSGPRDTRVFYTRGRIAPIARPINALDLSNCGYYDVEGVSLMSNREFRLRSASLLLLPNLSHLTARRSVAMKLS